MGEVIAIQTTDALGRVVAAAKKLEQHEEFDRWELSDDIVDAVDDLQGENGFPLEPSGVRTGLYAAVDIVEAAVRKAGVLSVGRKSIVGAYTTAKAWPSDERVAGATYWAHHELRGQDYHGKRQAILSKLVRQSSTGRVGPKDVRLWKSDRRPYDITPRDERLQKYLVAALHRWATPQKFNQLHPDEQATAAKLLYRLAREVETGEFA